MFDLESLKSFDWRSLQKYASPQAAEDLNAFLEKIPQNTNQTMLIILGVVWGLAGGSGLYTTVQLQQLTELRASLADAKSLQPTVPEVVDVPVKPQEIKEFVEKMNDIYDGLDIKPSGGSVTILAKSTSAYGQFREAISHIQNGGAGWRAKIERLCVGRECDRSPLAIQLKINKVSVKKPG